MTVETMHAPRADRYHTINWITFVAMSVRLGDINAQTARASAKNPGI